MSSTCWANNGGDTDVAGVVPAYHGIWQHSWRLTLTSSCFQQLRTTRKWAGSTLFILVRQGCPLLWHRFTTVHPPDHKARMKRPLRYRQWEEHNFAQWSPSHYQWNSISDQCLLICMPEVKWSRVQLQRLPTDMPANVAAVQTIITCLHAGLKIAATWMTLYMTLMVHSWVYMDAWEGPRGTIWVPVSGLLWVWNHEQHQLG